MDFEFARSLLSSLSLLEYQRVLFLCSLLERETHIPFVVPPSPYQTRIGLQVHFRVERLEGHHEGISATIAANRREPGQRQCSSHQTFARARPPPHLPIHGRTPSKGCGPTSHQTPARSTGQLPLH